MRLHVAALAFALACGPAGDDVTRLRTMVEDPAAYARQVEAECAAAKAASCTSLGVHHAFGTYGRAKDPAAAIPFLQRGCDGGDPNGCKELGVMYQYGRGVPQDRTRARAHFEGACDAGVALACTYAAELHAKADGDGADPALAPAWRAKACAAGSKSECPR